MNAIRQFIEVKNNTFQVILPEGFTASRVEVIILPLEVSNDNVVPQWQKDTVIKRMEAIRQNPNLLMEEELFWNDIENEG
jgi:hypothetical protein